MASIKNSELMENVLSTVINISSRKTNKGHAIFTMNKLLKNLETRFDFLKNIEVNDIRYTENENPVTVMTGIDKTKSEDVGRAIHDIIFTMNRSLGTGAGLFFIKEIRNTLDDEYISSMKDIGVDLGVMQLEHEVEEIEKSITKKLNESK